MLLILSAIVIVIIAIWIIVPRAREHSHNVSIGKQWLDLLAKHPTFSAKETEYPIDVKFCYDNGLDDNLKKLRDTYDLESVAGKGSEIDRIINLMSWVYNLVGHENRPEFPKERNAFTLIHMALVEKKQINCYMKTIILNEVYLSMGFCSRHTHLLPHHDEAKESHFITSVYSRTLGKWILMDPDFGVYMTDENDNILGVREIRQRIVSGEQLKAKHPSKSRIGELWINLLNFIEGADYRWFLSEFVFKIDCPKNSMFNQDSRQPREYFELLPDRYKENLLQKPEITERGNTIFYINDEDLFWSEPTEQGD
jgi:hypothetical protein